MKNWLDWLGRRADNVAVALLVIMFASFLLQIFSRYVVRHPLGWTVELCLMSWLWLVFWGNAFLVKNKDHVTFDILYLASPAKLRRAFALVSAVALLIALAAGLPDSLDYIEFIHIKKSAILRIPLDWVFSIYALFLVGLIIRYVVRVIALIRGAPLDDQTAKETP